MSDSNEQELAEITSENNSEQAVELREGAGDTAYKYLFGPVPSRRLGRSLGVDPVPLKTCSQNCVFCQLGPTAHPTVERREYVPTEDVFREIDRWQQSGRGADYITLSGSGEPTLHSRFGDMIEYAGKHTTLKTALLTNGSQLHLPEVREGAVRADLVKMTLSAWDEPSYLRMHRPHPEASFERLLAGEQAFRRQFDGQLWIEVFVLDGFNAEAEQMEQIAKLVDALHPDRVQLNTAVRPPAELGLRPVPQKRLEELATLFTSNAECVAAYHAHHDEQVQLVEADVLALLQRRPCSAPQMCAVFGLHPNELSKHLGKLCRMGTVTIHEQDGMPYYFAEK